jgi:hypothetical protein
MQTAPAIKIRHALPLGDFGKVGHLHWFVRPGVRGSGVRRQLLGGGCLRPFGRGKPVLRRSAAKPAAD